MSTNFILNWFVGSYKNNKLKDTSYSVFIYLSKNINVLARLHSFCEHIHIC